MCSFVSEQLVALIMLVHENLLDQAALYCQPCKNTVSTSLDIFQMFQVMKISKSSLKDISVECWVHLLTNRC